MTTHNKSLSMAQVLICGAAIVTLSTPADCAGAGRDALPPDPPTVRVQQLEARRAAHACAFEPDRPARRVGAASMDLCEFLFERKRQGHFNRDFKSTPGKIAYHIPCHLKAQNIGFRSRDMMRFIPGTQITMVEQCSAHDGTWAMKREFFPLSMLTGKKAHETVVRAMDAAGSFSGIYSSATLAYGALIVVRCAPRPNADGGVCLDDWRDTYDDWSDVPTDVADEIVRRADLVIVTRIEQIAAKIHALRIEIADWEVELATLRTRVNPS